MFICFTTRHESKSFRRILHRELWKQWATPPNTFQKECQIECQIEYQNICQIPCQNAR